MSTTSTRLFSRSNDHSYGPVSRQIQIHQGRACNVVHLAKVSADLNLLPRPPTRIRDYFKGGRSQVNKSKVKPLRSQQKTNSRLSSCTSAPDNRHTRQIKARKSPKSKSASPSYSRIKKGKQSSPLPSLVKHVSDQDKNIANEHISKDESEFTNVSGGSLSSSSDSSLDKIASINDESGESILIRTASSSDTIRNDLTNDTFLNNSPDPLPPMRKFSSKKKKNFSLIGLIKPINQEVERDRFFKSNFSINPQFKYRFEIDPKTVFRKHRIASTSLIPVAVKIMDWALNKYKTYEQFQTVTGGKVLTRQEIIEKAKQYLKKEKLENEVSIQLSDDLVSRACMTKIGGKPTVVFRVHNLREHWMDGILKHEIGTHYLRSRNNRQQAWRKSKSRSSFGMGHQNPTEEGLASLHSVIGRKEPCLWRCALLYYTVAKATEMSFVDLFRDLEKFVMDPMVRWDYCLRAKRGLKDTSVHGAFCKDQVYLQGALEILYHRHNIDFISLMQLGKISFHDIENLREQGTTDGTLVPSFMLDQTEYRMHLNDILYKNGLSDVDLRKIDAL